MRIVPESSGSPGRVNNFPLYLASESGTDFSAFRYSDHADVPGPPVSHTLQLRDEQGIIGGIVASGGESRSCTAPLKALLAHLCRRDRGRDARESRVS